jgi:peroxiredoxin
MDNNDLHPNRATALKVGDHAPDFRLAGNDGRPYSLTAALATGPVVLVFYRGDW